MFLPEVATQQNVKIIKVSPSSVEQWKKDRSKGVGGSEIGAVLGLNQYKTGYDVWLEKTGRKQNNVDNVFVRSGKYVETAIASLTEDEHENIAINKSSIPDVLYIHPEKQHLRVTPDRIYWNLNFDRDNKGILECKNTLKDIDPEEVDYWEAQIIYAMVILGLNYGMLSWLERGTFPYYKYYEMNKENADYAKYMIEEIDHFWNDHVLKDIPPEPKTGMETEQQYQGEEAEKYIVASDEIKEKTERLKEIKQRMKEDEKEEEKLKNDIKPFIKDAEGLTDSAGNKLITWKKTSGSAKFNQKSFKEQYPELFEQFVFKSKGSRRLLIK